MPARSVEGLRPEGDSTEGRIDGLEKRLDEKYGDGIEPRVGKLEQGFVKLETQMTHVIAGLSEVNQTIKELSRDLAASKIWALFIAGGVLSIMGRVFHWF